jgi:hypothetical protein
MIADIREPSIPTYVIVDRPSGFDVEGAHDIVRVRLLPTNWEVWTLDEGPRSCMSIPLYSFGLVREKLINSYLQDDYRAQWRLEEGSRARAKLERSLKRKEHQLRKLLGPPVHRRLRRVLSRVSPLMLAIQHATRASRCDAQASTEYYASVLPDPAWIQDPHVHRDILTHRAAAIAAGHLTKLVPAWLRRVVPDLADAPPSALDDPATRVAIAARHPFLASEAGLEVLRQWMVDWPLGMSATLVEAMRFWQDLFSRNGVSDERLEHTLANVPEGFPDYLLCALRHVRVRRPLTDRLELLVTTIVARRYDDIGFYEAALDRNADVLLDARHDEIVQAMRRVGAYFGHDLEPRYTGYVRVLVDFLLDYPEPHRGSIVGLAEEAIASDLRTLERDRSEVVATLGASTPSARPPIPLPDIPGVRFLATVQEIADTGVELRSRLARSARRAVDGNWYVFRVDHDGGKGAVRVGRDGLLAPPPYPECRPTWGQKTLHAWAAGFRPTPRP